LPTVRIHEAKIDQQEYRGFEGQTAHPVFERMCDESVSKSLPRFWAMRGDGQHSECQDGPRWIRFERYPPLPRDLHDRVRILLDLLRTKGKSR
jgi:hypothetical protein